MLISYSAQADNKQKNLKKMLLDDTTIIAQVKYVINFLNQKNSLKSILQSKK